MNKTRDNQQLSQKWYQQSKKCADKNFIWGTESKRILTEIKLPNLEPSRKG